MKTRTIIIVGGVLVLFGIAGALTYFFLQKDTALPTGGTFFSEPTDIPSLNNKENEKMVITVDGSYTAVHDFTPESTKVSGADGGNYYDLVYGEGPIFGNEGYTFEIQFDDTRSEFLIVLVSEPLSQSRIDAETFLLKKLATDEKTLCTLNVFVAVPLDVNEFYGQYKNLGLSFCEGSIALP